MCVAPTHDIFEMSTRGIFCGDADARPQSGQCSRYVVVKAKQAAIVGFAFNSHSSVFTSIPSCAARITITVPVHDASAARNNQPG